MIRAIIYDCFGVLTADRWLEFTATLPVDVSRAVRETHRAYDKGLVTYEDFRDQTAELANVQPSQVDDIFQKHAGHTKNQELLEHIARLKKNYKIGIISNVGTAWIREQFLTTDEQALFDDMVLSFEVGLSKPDPLIYELTCQRLNVLPQEVVFIDDLQSYCHAAEAVGMQGIQYQGFSQYKEAIEVLLANPDK